MGCDTHCRTSSMTIHEPNQSENNSLLLLLVSGYQFKPCAITCPICHQPSVINIAVVVSFIDAELTSALQDTLDKNFINVLL